MKKFIILLSLFIFATSSVSAKEFDYQKDLVAAIDSGKTEVAEKCINNGANVNPDGECLLCYAIVNRQPQMAELLLKYGANPNGTSKLWRPLFFALHDDNNYILDKLLEYKADVNAESYLPFLTLAVNNRNAYAVKRLLEAGADETKTFMKVTPFETAFGCKQMELVDVFLDYQNSKLDGTATDIDKSIELLNTIESGKTYYQSIKGANRYGKPINIKYANISNFGYDSTRAFAITFVINKQLYIYIDNRFRKEPPEIIAIIVAGETIHMDKKTSKVEALCELGIETTLYRDFLKNNPSLAENKESITIEKNFNKLHKLLEDADWNYNVLWLFYGILNDKLSDTSSGFRNKDLNSYFYDLNKSE